MGLLTDQIRRLTGVSLADVSNGDIQAALDEHRVWNEYVAVCTQPNLANTVLRGNVRAWGLFEPSTNVVAGGSVTVTNSTGAAITGTWNLSTDGDIVFGTDQALAGTIYVAGYTYDTHAAAVDVLDQLLSTYARDYDVKLGDQSFSRSQAVTQLETRRARLAARMLPMTVQRVRGDEQPTGSRVSVRLERRGMRE